MLLPEWRGCGSRAAREPRGGLGRREATAPRGDRRQVRKKIQGRITVDEALRKPPVQNEAVTKRRERRRNGARGERGVLRQPGGKRGLSPPFRCTRGS